MKVVDIFQRSRVSMFIFYEVNCLIFNYTYSIIYRTILSIGSL